MGWARAIDRCKSHPKMIYDIPCSHESDIIDQSDRPLWQRSEMYIYPAKEIISKCYYNRNETETVVADQLKQASNDYYPSRIYINVENFYIPI
jgi:hypothetical protein